jgi:hypothetical protein
VESHEIRKNSSSPDMGSCIDFQLSADAALRQPIEADLPVPALSHALCSRAYVQNSPRRGKSEHSWHSFLELDARHGESFSHLRPATLSLCGTELKSLAFLKDMTSLTRLDLGSLSLLVFRRMIATLPDLPSLTELALPELSDGIVESLVRFRADLLYSSRASARSASSLRGRFILTLACHTELPNAASLL